MTDVDQVDLLFRTTFGGAPEGVWSSPGRVNLIGEHTDYSGGFVMPMAIGERAYIAARPRADRLIRAVAQDRGVSEVSLDDVGPSTPNGWLAYLSGSAWVAAESRAPSSAAAHGWDLALTSDVPVGAGLSSSAAITCATLLAMDELDQWGEDRQTLARWAQRVENVVVGMPCGIMDQTASLLCEQEHLLFMDTRSHAIEQVPWRANDGALILLVTNTNAPHLLVDGQYASRRRNVEEATSLLGVPALRDASLVDVERASGLLTPAQAACARHVVTENARVLRVRALLEADQVRDVGPELTASHVSLRDDFRVTVPQVDLSVDTALAAGAFGARMTGGGFGGCTIALIAPEAVARVSERITEEFAHAGFAAPDHFVAVASQGGRRDA